MKKLICLFLLFVSVVVSVNAFGHPEGDCGYRTDCDKYIGLCGKVRIVGKNEMADVCVRLWKPEEKFPSNVKPGTPILFVNVLKSKPSFYCCGEFQVVKSGEDFTIKLVEDGETPEIIVRFGNPRQLYSDGVIHYQWCE